MKSPRTNKNLALHAAGVLVVYFGKKGDVSGHFDIPEMAQIIEREAIRRDRRRLARRFRRAARTNKVLRDRMEEAGQPHSEAYASGSQFGFSHAADLALGRVK